MEGRVQGVFFRDFARQEARRLGVTGWVANEPDGSVGVVAQGPRAALEKLLTSLGRGPPSARVTRVESHWEPARGEFSHFRIRFS